MLCITLLLKTVEQFTLSVAGDEQLAVVRCLSDTVRKASRLSGLPPEREKETTSPLATVSQAGSRFKDQVRCWNGLDRPLELFRQKGFHALPHVKGGTRPG